jgi:Na+-driven multidrug efflux pump
MFLLLACYPLIYGNVLHTSLANAKLQMRSLAMRETASAVVNLALTLVLVGYYQMGAIGAASSTFIVYGLGSILFFWPFGKGMAGATWREVWSEILLPGLMPFVAAFLAMTLLAMTYPVGSWVDILLNAMMGTSVYFVILWLVAKPVDKSQVREAMFWMRRR